MCLVNEWVAACAQAIKQKKKFRVTFSVWTFEGWGWEGGNSCCVIVYFLRYILTGSVFFFVDENITNWDLTLQLPLSVRWLGCAMNVGLAVPWTLVWLCHERWLGCAMNVAWLCHERWLGCAMNVGLALPLTLAWLCHERWLGSAMNVGLALLCTVVLLTLFSSLFCFCFWAVSLVTWRRNVWVFSFVIFSPDTSVTI